MKTLVNLAGLALLTAFSFSYINQSGCTDNDGDGCTQDVDCNDNDPDICPDFAEVCDDKDNNCDGLPDNTADVDEDEYFNCTDCDDLDPNIHPDAAEVCDGKDSNCDGTVPTDEFDVDVDGVASCAGDCNDLNPDVYPGAEELCDSIDNDCDGVVPSDEIDDDLDGYTDCDGDCDDSNAATYPGATEICDGLDNDCDASLPADEADPDLDGWSGCEGDCDDATNSTYPGAPELCDAIDQNCDGLADVVVNGNSGWLKSVCNAVVSGVSGAYDGKGVDQPSVLFNSDLGIYQMWYRAIDASNVQVIAYATSTNGVNWEKKGAVFTKGATGAWDSNRVGYPAVIYSAGTYEMYYQGQDSTTSNFIRIGLATSTDGMTWTRYASNPVLNLGTSGTWDSKFVQAPSVIKETNPSTGATVYRMWYTGSDNVTFNIGYAESADGKAWTKHSGNPVLKVGASGSWDSKRVIFANVRHEGSTYMMWYSGDDTSGTLSYEIGYASGTDPVTWTKYERNPILSFGTSGSFDSFMVYAPYVMPAADGYSMYYSGGTGTSSAGPYAIGIARNSIPNSVMMYPGEGTVSLYGQTVDFMVAADDLDIFDGMTAVWTSDRDGLLGVTASDENGVFEFSTHRLSRGEHLITATVSDLGGLTSSVYTRVIVN